MSFISLITGSFRNVESAKGIFVETETYEKVFADYYEKKLKKHINIYEKERIKTLERSSRCVKIFIFILIITLLTLPMYFYYIDSFSTPVPRDSTHVPRESTIAQLLFILYGCIFILEGKLISRTYNFLEEYKSSIKSKIFPKIISFYGSYKYQPECYDLITEKIKKSGIIPIYDNEETRDKISGEYKGVKIILFYTVLSYIKNGKSKTWKEFFMRCTQFSHIIFKGIIICCDVHKNFKGRTIIKKDFGKVKNFIRTKPDGLENIKLEDPKFEKMFEVYSTNQVEARYLLTTYFYAKIIKSH